MPGQSQPHPERTSVLGRVYPLCIHFCDFVLSFPKFTVTKCSKRTQYMITWFVCACVSAHAQISNAVTRERARWINQPCSVAYLKSPFQPCISWTSEIFSFQPPKDRKLLDHTKRKQSPRSISQLQLDKAVMNLNMMSILIFLMGIITVMALNIDPDCEFPRRWTFFPL